MMSRESIEYGGRVPRRVLWRRRAGLFFAVAVFVALVTPAMAAKSGCWGQCGGVVGPKGGYFVVANNQVQQFAIEDKCLGILRDVLPGGAFVFVGNQVQIPNMAIGKHGGFSFKGRAHRYTSVGKRRRVDVTLDGRFVTPLKASISLSIKYGSCGTRHATILHRR